MSEHRHNVHQRINLLIFFVFFITVFLSSVRAEDESQKDSYYIHPNISEIYAELCSMIRIASSKADQQSLLPRLVNQVLPTK